ncbi:MAG: ATP-binding cassette domain-containing protein [Chromatiaceae bacterium]
MPSASDVPIKADGCRLAPPVSAPDAHIRVQGLTMAYGDFVVMRDLDFTVRRGDIFIIMGGSGCGKSTLMRHLIGLKRPAAGKVFIGGLSLWDAEGDARDALLRQLGVMYQSGALWSSLTLAENIALPLEQFTNLSAAAIREVAAYKLALVGLAGFEDYYPAEISGGMQKRAGVARAMALDPEILVFDEPSAGLDPVSARRLDDLILELRDSLGTTMVVVTHELASLLGIGTNAVYLDVETRTQIALGRPRGLLETCRDAKVQAFLTRGGGEPAPEGPAGGTNGQAG